MTETGRLCELCRSASAAENGSVDNALPHYATIIVSTGEPPASSGSSAATAGQPPIYATVVKVDRSYQQLTPTESVPRYEFIVVENDQSQEDVEGQPGDGEQLQQQQQQQQQSNDKDDEQPSVMHHHHHHHYYLFAQYNSNNE